MTSQDWQATIRGLFTIGRATDYPGIGGVEGVGIEPFDFTGSLRSQGNDVAYGRDRVGPRRLVFPVRVLGTTEADTWGNVRALASAWRPQPDETEVSLEVRWPGMAETAMTVFGHPGRVSPGIPGQIKSGHIDVTCEFWADAWWYGAEVSASASATTPHVLAATGETGADTDRIIFTVDGNGGFPKITHANGGYINFTVSVAGPDTAVIDVHNRTVTVNGVNADNRVDPASTWFRFDGGTTNTITANGMTGLDVVYRPAYWSP